MAFEKLTRRTIIFGAASTAVAVPTASGLLLPESVIAAATPTGPGQRARRGPAHDWLDNFANKKRHAGDDGQRKD